MIDHDRGGAANLTRAEAEQADRTYNEALTALDDSIILRRDEPGPSLPWPDAVLPPPAGVLKPWLRVIHRWLAPIFARQRTFDNNVVEAIEVLADRDRDRALAFARFQTALMIFLQKITAFVESKDRLVAASIDQYEQRLNQLPDIQAQLAILQRATQMLTRSVSSQQSVVGGPPPREALRRDLAEARPSAERAEAGPQYPESSAVGARPSSSPQPSSPSPFARDYQYIAFEDRFRGSDDEIREKLRTYVPLFTGARDVLDIGCGRGEFLGLLKASGIGARGVDTNREMVATARERGLDVVESDALGYLESLENASLGGLMASQVVEHLAPSYLVRLLGTAFQKLRPGAPIVVETINPACWLAFFSSYIRDFTHAQPIHPETLQYLLQANGFGRVTLQYSQPVPEHMKMQAVDVAALVSLGSGDAQTTAMAQMARTLNANAAVLNNLLFTYFDYAAIGYRS